MAAPTVAAASAGPRTVEPRPWVAKAATVERPVRVRGRTGEHVAEAWVGERVAEFEAWLQTRTVRREEGCPWVMRPLEVAVVGGSPRQQPSEI